MQRMKEMVCHDKKNMRKIFFLSLITLLFLGCEKADEPLVEFYMLKSYTSTPLTASPTYILEITNVVLEDQPLVQNKDIAYYTLATNSFKIKRDIKPALQKLKNGNIFAVAVNKQVIYYGRIHSMYLSSMIFGMATMDNLFFINNELKIEFNRVDGWAALDKRNDPKLISALRSSARIR
jgi:hypothetical protein